MIPVRVPSSPQKRCRLIRSTLRSAAVVLVLGGCRSASAGAAPPADPPVDAQPSRQAFYCERSYTNFARGYQHRGIYVDPSGGVHRYRHGRADAPLLRVPADSLTERALLARYAPGRGSAGTVAPAEMAQRYQDVLAAREGARTGRVRRMADAGATVRRCWLPDAGGVYREVFLRQTGDWEQASRAPAATRLSGWLDSLALMARP